MSAPPGERARAKDERALGIAILAGVTLAWGVNWPIMKIGVTEFAPLTYRGLIGIVGGLVVLAAAAMGGASLKLARRQWGMLATVTFFHMTLFGILVNHALTLVSSGRAAVIAFTMPLWAAVWSYVIAGERLTLRQAAALALGLGGIAVLAGDAAAGGPGATLGIALIALAAASWALGVVLVKRVQWSVPTLVLSGWMTLGGSVPIFALAVAFEGFPLANAGPAGWIAVAYGIVIGMALGSYGWMKVVSLLPIVLSTVGSLLIPVVGVISGNLVLGESVGWREGTALILVVAAQALAMIPGRRGGGN